MDRIGVDNVIDQKVGKQVQGNKAEIDQLGGIAEKEEFARGLAEDPAAEQEQHQPEIVKALAFLLGLYGEGEHKDQGSQKQQ
jgi:hypothetical protein